MRIYKNILQNTEMLVGQKKLKREGAAVNVARHFGHDSHRFVRTVIKNIYVMSYGM